MYVVAPFSIANGPFNSLVWESITGSNILNKIAEKGAKIFQFPCLGVYYWLCCSRTDAGSFGGFIFQFPCLGVYYWLMGAGYRGS